MLERLLSLDDAFCERRVFKIQRRILDDVDIAAGTRGDGAQELRAMPAIRRLRQGASRAS